MFQPIGRRKVLVSGMLAPLASRAVAMTPAAVKLTAGRRTLEVNGKAATVFGVTQPDGTHGLATTVDQPFRVQMVNGISDETLIHWHGLTPPYQQDGVPGVSGPPIAPGATADYDFALTEPGTYWMHSHVGFQEQALLSAPLIIRAAKPEQEREVVLMLHDFSFRDPREIFSELRRRPKPVQVGMSGKMAPDLNDVSYDAFLANDRTLADPQVIRVSPGEAVRLRIINGAAASNFHIDLGSLRGTVLTVDGHPVHKLSGSRFPLAIAQRIDLMVRLPNQGGAWPVLAVVEGLDRRAGIILATAGARIARLPESGGKPSAAVGLELEEQLRGSAPLAVKRADRVLPVALTGDMAAYIWTLNNKVYGQDAPLMVKRGERVELVMTNRTMMSHPMHLHGHVFQVVAINGRRLSGAMRDTVLMPPKTTVTVAFDADNPGRWAFHCHNLYHLEAGMMTTVQYETL